MKEPSDSEQQTGMHQRRSQIQTGLLSLWYVSRFPQPAIPPGMNVFVRHRQVTLACDFYRMRETVESQTALGMTR